MFATLSNGGFGFLSLYRELFYYMNGADEWVGSCGVSLLGKRKKKDRMIKKQAKGLEISKICLPLHP